MDLMNHVPARIRELRLRHALTQMECAELVGMDYKFFQKLESGQKKQIWLETVERLARAFELEAWEFLAPELPARSKLTRKVMPSNMHYAKRRRGPYCASSPSSAPAPQRGKRQCVK